MATITITQPSPANVQSGQLSITAAMTPNSQFAASAVAQLSASGGVAPYTWELIAGQVPDGLSFAASGTIGGTPQAHGSALLMVRATDAASPPSFADAMITMSVS